MVNGSIEKKGKICFMTTDPLGDGANDVDQVALNPP
jgi:hypothetical protein